MTSTHPGLTVWLTGLSSSGKSTLGTEIRRQLVDKGYRAELLDGDEVRANLSHDLGFTKKDRDEQIRRIGFIAQLLTRNEIITIVSAISPYRAAREAVRSRIPSFMEVYVNAPLDVCETRDVKGLYRKARAGQIQSFTGIDDPYEPPLDAEVVCYTDLESVAVSATKVIDAIHARLRAQATDA